MLTAMQYSRLLNDLYASSRLQRGLVSISTDKWLVRIGASNISPYLVLFSRLSPTWWSNTDTSGRPEASSPGGQRAGCRTKKSPTPWRRCAMTWTTWRSSAVGCDSSWTRRYEHYRMVYIYAYMYTYTHIHTHIHTYGWGFLHNDSIYIYMYIYNDIVYVHHQNTLYNIQYTQLIQCMTSNMQHKIIHHI